MLSLIQKNLYLKIIIAVTLIIACSIGTYTYFDIRRMRSDTIRTSERTLGAFAAAIKGSVTASMKKGHHEDVQHLLEEVNAPSFINRVMIYNENGRPLKGVEKMREGPPLDIALPPAVIGEVAAGDLSRLTQQKSNLYISYYSPIENRQECFRCHGANARLNGILRIDFSLNDLDDLIASRRNRDLLGSVLLIVLLSGVLVALLRTLVHRPLKELRDAMADVEEGRGPRALSLGGHDELADLKKSFVNMLDRISALHEKNVEKEKEIAHSQEVLRFRAELQTMFDAMPDGVLLIDRNMRIVQSNPRVYSLVPQLQPVGGLIGADLETEEFCPFQGIADALKNGKITTSQCRVALPNQEPRHLHSICAPVVENGRAEYVVQVIRDVTDRVRTERELEEKTAELLAANRLLSRLAVTDSLTQVYNRRYFDELLYKEVKRFNRRKYSHLSLMMIDIDRFKQLNDRYGHLAGDMVLREVATMLRENVRETDTVARYGGEEFAIVMPDTRLDGAAYRAEVLRKKIEARVLYGRDASIRTTISIGVATLISGGPHDLVQSADQALYQAKRAGRNTVFVGRPEVTVKE